MAYRAERAAAQSRTRLAGESIGGEGFCLPAFNQLDPWTGVANPQERASQNRLTSAVTYRPISPSWGIASVLVFITSVKERLQGKSCEVGASRT